MKKIYYLGALILFGTNTILAQTPVLQCGSDDLMRHYFNNNPAAKKGFDKFNLELSQLTKRDELSRRISSKIQEQQVYEIPVVVHVLGKGDAIGTEHNPGDQQIIEWINYTNNVFNGTANGILNETNGGAVIPVKLVLAKIDPKGKATNGINRVDLSHHQEYVAHGINAFSSFDGMHDVEVIKNYGWEPTKYYNIYVAHKVSQETHLLNGYAHYPHADQSNDKIVMTTSVTKVGEPTMPHEFGHALGLMHPHEGYVAGEGALATNENGEYIRDANGDPIINVTQPAVCPLNNDCTLEGDLVCDTEPSLSLQDPTINLYRCLTDEINQCTGFPYGGVEQNIMSYTSCFVNRFTQGQADRAVAELLRYRENLFTSPVLANTINNNHVSIIPASCTPTTIQDRGDFRIGTVNVNFNEINNWTTPYNTIDDNFYKDYTGDYLLAKTTTAIPSNSPTQLNIKTSDVIYGHALKVYIDYNNDGVFSETDELVLFRTNIPENSITSVDVTPPHDAVVNTPLRMRVISDYTEVDITSCGNPMYGDVEDYAVTIVGETLSTNDLDLKKIKIATNGSTILVNANDSIASITITDITGKLIYKEDDINKKNFSKIMNTKNQVYVVVVALKNGTKYSQKVIL